jgi:hypothetical protein
LSLPIADFSIVDFMTSNRQLAIGNWQLAIKELSCGYGPRAESPRSQLASAPRYAYSQVACRGSFLENSLFLF